MLHRLIGIYGNGLRRLFSSRYLDRIFSGLPAPAAAHKGEGVTLCALQLEAKTYPGPEAWLRELDSLLARAAAQGADLVCLPELYGMIIFLCHPVVHTLLKLLPDSGSGDGGVPELELLPVLERLSFVNGIYEDIISRFARRYGIHIYGGTAFVATGGKLFNQGFLTGPEGTILARHKKLHLTREEMQLGLSTGDALQVVSTPIGNIALCVCMDATYFETFRIARNLGADYIIVPIGDMAEFDLWLALRGAQTRVSETGLAAVKPALVSGKGFPMCFTGRAGIYFPQGSSFSGGETDAHQGTGMILARINLADLRNYKSEPFLRSNPGFARNYYTALLEYRKGESA